MNGVVGFNPLDWAGPPFLLLFLWSMLVTLALVPIIRTALRPCGDEYAGPLSPAELGLLCRGTTRAGEALIIQHLVQGEAELQPGSRTFRMRSGIRLTHEQFLRTVRDRVANADHTLVGKGLRPPLGTRRLVRVATLLVVLPVLALGAMKLDVGLHRHKPVGFLTGLEGLSVIGACLLVQWPLLRTAAGDAYLIQQWRHRAARAPMKGELPLAFALAGPSALAGTVFAPYGRMAAGQGSGSESGCGGDAGGGGGGCSGGGCGGCGGG